MKRFISLCGLWLAGFTAAAAATALPFQRFVLPNGLIVLAVSDKSSVVAAFHLAARFDPAALSPERQGLPALSQQTLQIQLAEILRQEPWQELGEQLQGPRADLNLNTEPDFCEISGRVTNERLPQALQLCTRMLLAAPTPTAEQLEQARGQLNSAQQDQEESQQAVLEATYYCLLRAFLGPRSPWAQPVQGTIATRGAISLDEIVQFRKAFLTPNNAVLTVVAPRPAHEIAELARLAAGEIPGGQKTVERAKAPAPRESRVYVRQWPGWRAASLMLGMPAPPFGTPDFYKAMLIYALLEGPQGRLATDPALRGEMAVNRVGGQRPRPEPAVTLLPPMAHIRPLFIAHVVVRPRELEPARQALLKHFLRLQNEPPTPAELQRARARLLNFYARLQLDRDDLVKTLTCIVLYGGDPRLFWQIEQIVTTASGADLVALARQYFSVHFIGVIMPGEE